MINKKQSFPELTAPIYLGGMVIILLIATAMRLYALQADPPLHLSLMEGLNDDGAKTVGAARNMVLFGSWYPFPNFSRFYYLLPAISWLGYIFFSLVGVGTWQANFISVAMGLLSIALMAAFACQQFGRRVSLLTALFMTTNTIYLMYNRIPMIYSMMACGVSLAVYCLAKGLRRPHWFFLAGGTAAFTIGFIKITAIALIPTFFFSLLTLSWQRWHVTNIKAIFIPWLLVALGALPILVLYWFLIIIPQKTLVEVYSGSLALHTFHASIGMEENIRLAVQSLLQFGAREGIFLRMLPIFILAYGYLFYRSAQLLAFKPPRLKMGEVIALLNLVSGVLLLLIFAAAVRPSRYYLIIIPQMCLVAAIALDKWNLKASFEIPLPRQFNRFYPIFIMGGLTYFFYQIGAAVVNSANVLRVGTGLADPQTLMSIMTQYELVVIAMLLAMFGTMLFIWRTIVLKRPYLCLPSAAMRNWLAVLLIGLAIGADLYQYGSWARDPQFSIMEASRQVAKDIGPKAVLGGAYASALSLENNLPIFLFYPFEDPEQVMKFHFTHLALESDNTWHAGSFNDEKMRQTFPELMNRAKLIKTYILRGYVVKLYEVQP